MAKRSARGIGGGDVDITAQIETVFEGGQAFDPGTASRFADIVDDLGSPSGFELGDEYFQPRAANRFTGLDIDADTGAYARVFSAPNISARFADLEYRGDPLSRYLPILSSGGGLAPPPIPPQVYGSAASGDYFSGASGPGAMGFPLPQYARREPVVEAEFRDDPMADIEGRFKTQGAAAAARQRVKEIQVETADEFTEKYGFASTNSFAFKQVFNTRLAAEDLADPMGAAEVQRGKMSEFSKQFDNSWVESGEQVGTRGYQKARQEALVEAGFAEKETWQSRLAAGASGMGGAFGYGFGLMTVGQGVASYESLNNGQYVSPEQKNTAIAGAVGPGAGMIAGTVVGAALGGEPGALLGQFAGGAVGQAGAAMYGASSEREQSVRETSERLASVLASATESVERFKSAIEATGAPVAQLGQGLSTLAASGPGVTTSSVAGAGRVANALGEFYNEDTTNLTKFLSNDPALFGVAQQYRSSGGELNAGTLGGIADYALAHGDTATWQSARRDAARSTIFNDPKVQAAAKDFNNADWFTKLEAGTESFFGFKLGWDSGSRYLDDQDTISKAKAAADKAGADAAAMDQANFLALGQNRFDIASSQVAMGGASAAFTIAGLTGASGDQLTGLLPGISNATATRKGADSSYIALAQARNARLDPNDPAQLAIIQANNLDILTKQADQSQADLPVIQAARGAFEARVSDRESSISERLASGFYGGRSAREMAGVHQESIDYETSLAADGSFQSPSDRARRRMAAQKELYDTGLGIFEEDMSGLGVSGSALIGGAGDAQRTGTFSDVERANLGIAGNFLAKQARVEARLREAIPRPERDSLTIESNRLGEEASGLAYNAPISAYEGQRQSIGYDISDPGLSRRLRTLGNLGITEDDISSVRSGMALDQGELLRNRDPKRVSMLQDRIQGDQAMLDDRLETLHRYEPSARGRTSILNAETDFDIARMAPFMDGPDANPLTRGLALENVYGGQIASRNANRNRLKAAGQWDDLDEQNYASDNRGDRLRLAGIEHERLFDFERMIPSMLAGELTPGAQVAVTPTAAMSSRFLGANIPTLGGWGGNTPFAANAPGGAAGNFAAAGGSGSPDHGMQAEMVSLLRRLVANTEHHMPGPSAPMGSVVNQELGQTPSSIWRR